jgi:amidase
MRAERSHREATMRCEPTRRSFMAGIGAAATAGAVGPPIALARDEPAYRTAGELVEALAGKEVSSRELVDAAISRIERIDPKINSVVVRDFERAREAAVAADAALAKGERRPLLCELDGSRHHTLDHAAFRRAS